MISNTDFETYESYLELQAKYRAAYKNLERQYLNCKCPNCKLEMILFGLELLSLNSFVDHMESQISPEIGSILNTMQIDYIISDGQAELTN